MVVVAVDLWWHTNHALCYYADELVLFFNFPPSLLATVGCYDGTAVAVPPAGALSVDAGLSVHPLSG